MSPNSSVALSMPVNPEAWGQGLEREKIIVSCESSYTMHNIPTRLRKLFRATLWKAMN